MLNLYIFQVSWFIICSLSTNNNLLLVNEVIKLLYNILRSRVKNLKIKSNILKLLHFTCSLHFPSEQGMDLIILIRSASSNVKGKRRKMRSVKVRCVSLIATTHTLEHQHSEILKASHLTS
jgi:hypothetical protein